MIKANQRYLNWFNRLIDAAIIIFSYYFSVWFWFVVMGNDSTNIALSIAKTNIYVIIIFAVSTVALFQYVGLYDSFRFHRLWDELFKLLKVFSLCMVAVAGCMFFLKLGEFSRGTMLCIYVITYSLLSAKRICVKYVLSRAREAGFNRKHVIIVGEGSLARKYLDTINTNKYLGLYCTGYIGMHGGLPECSYLGTYSELKEILEQYNPDEIIIAIRSSEMQYMTEIISICEEVGIRTYIIPIYNDYMPSCASIDVIGDVKMINIREIKLDIWLNQFMKRVFDVVLSLVTLIILSPLMAAIAVAVKFSSPGPILFKQERVGKDRKPFYMYKFRSMRVNSDSNTAWSKNRDSRVTPIGAFIRKSSLDELPQFFNVLKGDMSVIGPRPELPYFVEQYKRVIPSYMVKHQVKPGITGWAQVNGLRGDTSIEERIKYDLWYIENWSIFLDIKIVFMTAFGGMINQEKNLSKEKVSSK